MPSLGQIVIAIENYRRSGSEQVQKARTDREFGERVLQRWQEAKDKNRRHRDSDRTAAAAPGFTGS